MLWKDDSTFVLRDVNIVRITNQPTMSDLLPAVLLNALRQYKFDGSPLWRMADGKDQVKIEVTFRKPTNQHFDKKGAESRRRPTPPAGEWPRQPAPARRPMSDNQTDASSKPTANYAGEGDNTTSTADITDRHSYHHSAKTTKDSTDHAFTYNTETSYTASFSGNTASKEAENQVTKDYKTAEGILPCQHRGRIPSAWEVWPTGYLRHQPQGHCKSSKTAQRSRGNQHRSSCLLRISAREQALATRQRAHQQVLRWSLVHHYGEADWDK